MSIQSREMATRSSTWPFYVFLFFYFSSKTHFSMAADSISPGQSLTGYQTIASKDGNFILGFFNPGNSQNYYIGIWYGKISKQTVVWVANRETPLSDNSSELKISEDGNLVLLNQSSRSPIWSTNSTINTKNSTVAVLLDSGNLEVRDGSNSSAVIWQSFDHPTDTWLPTGSLGLNKITHVSQRLTSWRSEEDPAPGSCSLEIDPQGTTQFVILWNQTQYWTSGVWNGPVFSLNPEMSYSYRSDDKGNYFIYSMYDTSQISRLVMRYTGQIQQLTWSQKDEEWDLFWYQPSTQCDVYSLCGPFGLCDEKSLPSCKCLEGFQPRSEREWNLSHWSGGCVRKTSLGCENKSSQGERFLHMTNMRLPENPISLTLDSITECQLACLNSCSCNAYAYDGGCSIWNGDLMNLNQISDAGVGKDLFLRLAIDNTKDAKLIFIAVVGVIMGAVTIWTTFFCFVWMWMAKERKLKKKGGHKKDKQVLFNLGKKVEASDISSQETAPELPIFSFSQVASATNNFSDENKLGEGGFGPVYKGMLPRGDTIAVKRLSKSSGQGLEEFKNEAMIISKVQHKNLVRLLGYCIESEEKILLYEYMPKKSLDAFLFGSSKQELINWDKRFHIVEGIARGILYLHRDSRLKIIHRDLKASNILLDERLNPKISDFGMARILGGEEILARTNRVVGTYGYMSPEYAMEGSFSEKSDVFSFGVLLLEIVSGKRNSSFYRHEQSTNLLSYTWKLWNESKVLELVDATLGDSYPQEEVLRCIHLGLLCVQEFAEHRPTMSSVIFMLGSDISTLPTPKQPAFTERSPVKSDSSQKGNEKFSINEVTISVFQGR